MRYALLIGSPDDVIDRGDVVLEGTPPPRPTPTTRYLGVTREFRRHPDSYSVSSAMTSAFDAAVKKDMENTGHRATALAVARAGDLVFADGYTYAEHGLYPQTTPNDVFRVGSLSKVITAIAVHQLHAKSQLLDKEVAALLGFTFKDRQGQEITVAQLLAHIGGIPKNAGAAFAKDRMEYDQDVADKVNGGNLPVDKDMVFEFITSLAGFVTSPGTAYGYSNTGYELLGEVVRKRAAGSLIDHVRNEIFTRVGIRLEVSSKAPRWAESERLTDQNGEVRYHDSSLSTTSTVATSSGTLIPSTYGAWNMSRLRGSAAWVISAPHYLRILSRFTIPGANPLFTSAAAEAKFTETASFKDFTKSKDTWGGLRVSKSGSVTTLSKIGAAPGARANSLFRSDGWSMVYLTDSDDGGDPNDVSDDGISAPGIQAWLDPSWNSIAADPTAWNEVYVTP
jgi:N-acyl-D-amino-acid deacylase